MEAQTNASHVMPISQAEPPILQACDLQKTYGRRRVVDGVNLHVGPSEIVGLLGPNGAGKSTSFRMICGMVEPDRGRVYLSGQDVTGWPMFRRARDGHMGYLPQEPSVFKKLTVEQNISALLELLGVDSERRNKRTDELLDEFNITHATHNHIIDGVAATTTNTNYPDLGPGNFIFH